MPYNSEVICFAMEVKGEKNCAVLSAEVADPD